MKRTFPIGFADVPLVAILRGLTAEEAPEIAAALSEAGICVAEVSLNRPGALAALRSFAAAAPSNMMVGCGTAVRESDISTARDAGARFVVSPNTDAKIIRATVAADLLSCPGFQTPTEAYVAIQAGADYLKLFPCDGLSPPVLHVFRSALPPDAPPILCVGGISNQNAADWLAAGAHGLGVGGALFVPGCSAVHVYEAARAFVSALYRQAPCGGKHENH